MYRNECELFLVSLFIVHLESNFFVQSVYWFCLAIGGAFVALSLVGGGELLDGLEADADFDVDADADFDVDADADFDADVDVDAGTDFQVDTDVALLKVKPQRRKRLPMLLSLLISFKFWTFGGFFFGLTGLVMTRLEPGLSSAVVFAIALIMGVVCGGALAAALRYLKHRQVDSLVRNEDFSGLIGTVELPFDTHSKGKVFLEVGGSTLHLIARTDEEISFQPGDRVLVVGRSQNRLWVVSDQHALEP